MSVRALLGNSQGQSIIQVLVAVVIMSILTLALLTIITSQNREMQSLTERLAAADFQQQLTRTLSDGTVCTQLLKGQTFDSSKAFVGSSTPAGFPIKQTVIPLSTATGAIPFASANAPASAIANNLFVAPTQPFQISNIVGSASGGVGNYSAQFQVNFDQSKLVRAIKPAFAQITLQTTSAGNTQTITACANSRPVPVGGCEQYVDGAGNILGNRFCWGAITDDGTSFTCQDGSNPVQVNSGEDFLSPGETTSNGANLYAACDNPANLNGCQVSTYFCF